MPKVSVITPVYADTSQKVDWLNEMIQSVISQSMIDWELIIIDDKSPLPIPLQNIYSAEPRIRWFSNAENYGPSATRNTAVVLMESDCILPLDSDDKLPHELVVEKMYDAWIMDKSKVVYGNLQQYIPIANGGQFERGKIFELPDYTFDRVMNLNGIMPVTAMHSVECWEQSGGWKNELKEGLEDVEYWLFAGKQGYCGHKINETTLLYRSGHENRRSYVLKHGDANTPVMFREMQNKIKIMHSDVYEGRFPVKCCGGKSDTSAQVQQVMVTQQGVKEGRVTRLEGYEEKDKIWVQYNGLQKGNFDVLARGANVPQSYHVMGIGHKFEVHKHHEMMFRQRARLGFTVGVQPPEDEPKPEIVTQSAIIEPSIVEIQKPPLSTIVRPDEIAMQSREFDIQPMPDEVEGTLSLDDLMLSPSIAKSLADKGYTLEKLADESIENLIRLPGIGNARASQIIAKAINLK